MSAPADAADGVRHDRRRRCEAANRPAPSTCESSSSLQAGNAARVGSGQDTTPSPCCSFARRAGAAAWYQRVTVRGYRRARRQPPTTHRRISWLPLRARFSFGSARFDRGQGGHGVELRCLPGATRRPGAAATGSFPSHSAVVDRDEPGQPRPPVRAAGPPLGLKGAVYAPTCTAGRWPRGPAAASLSLWPQSLTPLRGGTGEPCSRSSPACLVAV